jgi:hypothetical protein
MAPIHCATDENPFKTAATFSVSRQLTTKRIAVHLKRVVQILIVAGMAFTATKAGAATTNWDFHETYDVTQNAVFEISHDIGGKIEERAGLIRRMKDAQVAIRFSGRCYSSCTMMVAVPGACTTRRAMFAFHGPSNFGNPLPEPEHAYFMELMTRHYPEPLRSWFIEHPAKDHVGLKWLSGTHMIEAGILLEC